MNVLETGGLDAPLLRALQCAARMPERQVRDSAWNELIPLSFFLVALTRPKTVVELGVHRGASYCSFCQAVRDLALEARCFGIDSWEGDRQTGYYDKQEVLGELRGYHDPRYGAFSVLLESRFDDVLA